MKVQHKINGALLTRKVYVVVVGAGGTGSALLPRLMQLHHAMVQLGHPGGLHVSVYDPDTVSDANLGRQGFFPSDVGQYKACVLINRLNMAWGTDWTAYPMRINKSDKIDPDIIIGCVDTRKSRVAILGSVASKHAYYLDCGNSSNTGQTIIGEIGDHFTRNKKLRLPCVADLYPEAVDELLDKDDDRPSCSMAEALTKQNLDINNAIAASAFSLLTMLFREGTLHYCGQVINLQAGITMPIRMDTEVWAKMGYHARVPKKRVRTKPVAVVTQPAAPALAPLPLAA